CTHGRQRKMGTVDGLPSLPALLKVPLFRVSKSDPDPKSKASNRRDEQQNHALVDGYLAFLRSGLCRSIAHGTRLAERRYGAEQNPHEENGGPKLHFTPNERIRNASGKKISINERQATSAHIVSHFIREISYFMCMKKPMIKAAFISDKPIRIVSIRTGCMF